MTPAHPIKGKEWQWLLMNLLVLPGLGSIRGGRRRSGYWQLAISLVGFIVTSGALLSLGLQLIRSLQTEAPLHLDKRLVLWTTVGVVLFFVSWFWGLATGIDLVRGPSEPPLV